MTLAAHTGARPALPVRMGYMPRKLSPAEIKLEVAWTQGPSAALPAAEELAIALIADARIAGAILSDATFDVLVKRVNEFAQKRLSAAISPFAAVEEIKAIVDLELSQH